MLGIAFLAIRAARRTGKVIQRGAVSSSVSELYERLPNLKMYELVSCEFSTISSAVGGGLVPSPSDTMWRLAGRGVLSRGGSAKLVQSHDWSEVARDNLPVDLLRMLPSGDCLESSSSNRSFHGNPLYTNARLVHIKGNCDIIYFCVTDIDRSLE